MITPAKVGLLPLYLKLYDDRLPQMRAQLEPFLLQVIDALKKKGIAVVASPICRLSHEIAQAVHLFERDDVDCIVTLHLAYSPSLEALAPLQSTALPIVMCDTTMDEQFDPSVDPMRLLYNHGIHGVQDLASVLRRHGKTCVVAAGHMKHSSIMARTANLVRAARGAKLLRSSKVLRVGPVFEGMGDFAVPDQLLQESLGIEVRTIGPDDLAGHLSRMSPQHIEDEIARDQQAFTVIANPEAHRRAVRIGLALRCELEQGHYDAFSMHFGSFDARNPHADTVPFHEASKAMARGLGYAGEGDALTAALVGALNRAFGDTTFTEMFCPDWAGQSIFLSHMGETNPAIAERRPLLSDKPMPFCDSAETVIVACSPRPGPGCLVNIAPQAGDTFAMIVAPVQVLSDQNAHAMRTHIRGWIRPSVDVAAFLERYSQLGGTHHVALVLGQHVDAVKTMGQFMGIDVFCID
ncbi:MAG: hypothetical protein IT445_10705 [Phycisphaeraceae bacterium]|nr:hypothetical protein [Phycisphaeraceae bacterium]